MAPVETAMDSLHEHGFAIAQVSAADAAVLREAITQASLVLLKVHTDGLTAEQVGPVAGPDASAVSPSVSNPTLAAFRERSQLRYSPNDDDRGCSSLNAAVAAGTAVLSRLSTGHLAALRGEIGAPLDGHSQLDAFWYPGRRRWEELHVADELPAPCPAHEDAGLLTAIYDDHPALQVQLRDGNWRNIELGEDEVALIVGRALSAISRGRVPACTHRVRAVSPSRASLVLDTYPGVDGLRARSKAEAAHAAASADTGADAKYARAAGALLARESASEGRCVLM